MICLAFEGVGVTDLIERQKDCCFKNHYIDLTDALSSCDTVDAIDLLNVAIKLHEQGNFVFVKCPVQYEHFENVLHIISSMSRNTEILSIRVLNRDNFVVIYPSKELFDSWKDRIVSNHDENATRIIYETKVSRIEELIEITGCRYIKINDMRYNLNCSIDYYQKTNAEKNSKSE